MDAGSREMVLSDTIHVTPIPPSFLPFPHSLPPLGLTHYRYGGEIQISRTRNLTLHTGTGWEMSR